MVGVKEAGYVGQKAGVPDPDNRSDSGELHTHSHLPTSTPQPNSLPKLNYLYVPLQQVPHKTLSKNRQTHHRSLAVVSTCQFGKLTKTMKIQNEGFFVPLMIMGVSQMEDEFTCYINVRSVA